jgi:hypothetical protein
VPSRQTSHEYSAEDFIVPGANTQIWASKQKQILDNLTLNTNSMLAPIFIMKLVVILKTDFLDSVQLKGLHN